MVNQSIFGKKTKTYVGKKNDWQCDVKIFDFSNA